MYDSDQDYDYEVNFTSRDYADDDDVPVPLRLRIGNKDQNVLTKSHIGCMNKVSNDYFCYTWSIRNVFQYFESSQKVCLQSPEFKTGINNGNAWILKLIIDHNFLITSVQLHLISYKDPSNFSFYLSLLNEKNEKIKQSVKSVTKCNEGTMVCEFKDFLSEQNYYNKKIPTCKLTLLCEMISSAPEKVKTKHSKTDDLKLFLSSEKLSDVTVSVGETKFHLHKAILASRSEVFLAMFQHDTKENRENFVAITDVDEKIMKKVILYIYTDEIENLEEDACDILAVADKYGMEGLKATCNEELSNCITYDNVFQMLALADTYNANKLKIKSLSFIASNLSELIDMPGYKMLRNKYPHLIEKILLAVAKKFRNS